MTSKDSTELLLAPDSRRFVMFPLRFPALWATYKYATTCLWVAENVNTSMDLIDWQQKLSTSNKKTLTACLVFLSISQNPLQADLINQLSGRITSPEARCCFGFQSMMANIHTEALSKIFSALRFDDGSNIGTIKDIIEHPSTKKKIRWAYSWFESGDVPFSTKLFALAVIKELFSAPTFATLAWLKNEHIMPGVKFTSEKLSGDNEWFVDLACRLFHYMQHKPSQDNVVAIILEAVDIEKNFVMDVLQPENLGIKKEDITQYIEHIADELLCAAGYSVFFQSYNPIASQQFSFRPSAPASVKVTQFIEEARYRTHPTFPKRDTERVFTPIDTKSDF